MHSLQHASNRRPPESQRRKSDHTRHQRGTVCTASKAPAPSSTAQSRCGRYCSAPPSVSFSHLKRRDGGYNSKGKRTLAHPDYFLIQSMWHPIRNQGMHPADVTHASTQKVWLRCSGCIHGCGRQHEWAAKAFALTGRGGYIVCPACDCRSGGFCECRSVAADAKLSKEWHPSNPPAVLVAKGSSTKRLWICPRGHPAYIATCNSRSNSNTGCPLCGDEKKGTTRHPTVSVGRPDLASQWDHSRNSKSPAEVRLGSKFPAWWRCSNSPEHPPWQTEVGNRALKGKGCPECRSKNRFKPRKFGADRL